MLRPTGDGSQSSFLPTSANDNRRVGLLRPLGLTPRRGELKVLTGKIGLFLRE